MKYEIKQNVELEASQFVRLSKDIQIGNNYLQEGQYVLIDEVAKHKVIFTEFFVIGGQPKLKYGKYQHQINNSPAEQIQFEEFLSSIVYVYAPELIEANIPQKYWSKGDLMHYISFLEDQISDLEN